MRYSLLIHQIEPAEGEIPDDEMAEAQAAFETYAKSLDAALAWAEQCPAAHWGSIEVRPTAISYHDGAWQT